MSRLGAVGRNKYCRAYSPTASQPILQEAKTMKVDESFTEAGEHTRRLLIGMITDRRFLKRLSQRWEAPGMFLDSTSNLIGTWCINHYRKNRQVPYRDIQCLFDIWSDGQDKNKIDQANRLLTALNDQHWHSVTSTQALIELAEKYFTSVKLKRIGDIASVCNLNGKLEIASKITQEFRPVSLSDDFCRADQLKIEQLQWLWHGWLAVGELAIFDGIPGEGKSSLLLDIAARLSQGISMPPTPQEKDDPARVVILTAEDSWEHTVLPRLLAANADLSQIYTSRKITAFPTDIDRLERLVSKTDAKLLIVDPIMGFVGGTKTDTNAESHVRRFLNPLKDMARKTGIAVALIRHFKKESASAIHRGLGSQAWTALCRLQHVVGDPNGEGLVVLACGKSNLSKKPTSLSYRIEGTRLFVPDQDHIGKRFQVETSKINWMGQVPTLANEVAATHKTLGRPSNLNKVTNRIIEVLENREMGSIELQQLVMDELGIGESTFKKAKKLAKVKSHKKGFGQDSEWVCTL